MMDRGRAAVMPGHFTDDWTELDWLNHWRAMNGQPPIPPPNPARIREQCEALEREACTRITGPWRY